MKKIIFIFLSSLYLYAIVGGGLASTRSLLNKNANFASNNVHFTKEDYKILKNKPFDELSQVEAYLLGLAYFSGGNELSESPNKILASKYFRLSFNRGYHMALAHYLVSSFDIGKTNEALDFLSPILQDDTIEVITKSSALKIVTNYLIQNNDFQRAFIYIKYMSDMLNDSNSQVFLSLMYSQGVGVKYNKKMANYYLSKGCNGKNLDDYSQSVCSLFTKSK